MNECTYLCMYVCIHVFMSAWMDVCMYICMYVCMNVFIYVCIDLKVKKTLFSFISYVDILPVVEHNNLSF